MRYRVNCTLCDFGRTTDDRTHAKAIGRKHYHGDGHPVVINNLQKQGELV